MKPAPRAMDSTQGATDYGARAEDPAPRTADPAPRATSPAAEPLPRWPGPLGRLADRANPILVKEVRQALRGRYFRVTFWLTLSAAAVIGLVVLIGDVQGDDRGASFFHTIYCCLAVAAHGFVPFAAFVAMGNEWDENTYDLLVLSNLKPRQIVLGKLLSAGVQALLFYSAFGPFLVFAFLLGGVDLRAVLVVLAGSMLLSLALSATALALSSTAQGRFKRVVLMAILAGLLAWVTMASFWMGVAVVQMPGMLRDSDALVAMLAFASAMVVYSALPIALACARLAHAEENSSTPLRALALGLVAFGLGWVTYFQAHSPDTESLAIVSFLAVTFLFVAGLFFVTEPLRLGRRARLQIPRSRAAALLSLPLQPGGARALLWYLGGVGLVWAWYVVVGNVWPDRSEPVRGYVALLPLVLALYGLVYLGVPALLVRERGETAAVRVAIRLLAPALAVLSILVPALIGFFLDDPDLRELEHLANPAYVISRMWDGGADAGSGLVTLVVCGLFVLGLNAPRVLRAARESLQASAERRAARPAARSVKEQAPPVAGGV